MPRDDEEERLKSVLGEAVLKEGKAGNLPPVLEKIFNRYFLKHDKSSRYVNGIKLTYTHTYLERRYILGPYIVLYSLFPEGWALK